MPRLFGTEKDWPAVADGSSAAWTDATAHLFQTGEQLAQAIEGFADARLQAAQWLQSAEALTEALRAVRNSDRRVAKLLQAGKSDDQVIEELFLATLSRHPKTDEVDVAKRVIAKDRTIGFEDIQWALLNTTEFLVNH